MTDRPASPARTRGLPAGGAIIKVALPLAAGLLLAVLPAPAGLTRAAWVYFALFAAVVLAMITEPLPAGAVGLLGVTLASLLGLVGNGATDSIKWALSGFADATVWLIFGAFVFATGYEKTGLGRRIALGLVKRLGGRTLGLGYAIALTDLVLAPFTPSNTGRSGGVIFPIVRGLPELYGSAPGPSARRIGAYLMWTAFATTAVTSAMFLTALAPNPLAVSFALKITGTTTSWTGWALGFLPVGLLLVALTPLLTYVLYPPEIRVSREVPAWAGTELARMGPLSRAEITMALLVLVALALWIFGGDRIHPTQTVLLVVGLLLVTRVVEWDDLLGQRAAWNVLFWFATLLTLADGLARVGFVAWVAQRASNVLQPLPAGLVVVAFVMLFFFAHYLFASLTAHTTALFPVVLAAALALPGLPMPRLTLLLGYSIGLMGVLHPYATGPAVVYYGSGFISRRAFWLLGLIFGTLYLLALLTVGNLWLSMRLG
jgi:L-tartrate/succinate antiporter